MADKIENTGMQDKLNSMLEKSKNTICIVAGVFVVALIFVIVVTTIQSKANAKAIELIDTVTYSLTKNAEELTGDALTARQNEALESISVLSGKKGIAGIRSNMLIADIKFAQEKYDESADAWLKAAAANSNAYTAPLCYYNAAVCFENLDKTDDAFVYYSKAADFEDFILVDHALFNVGRVNEAKADYAAAKAAYDKIYELRPASSWAFLGKSRLIAMKAEGKIQ